MVLIWRNLKSSTLDFGAVGIWIAVLAILLRNGSIIPDI